jgi:diguanylate cyclase (GGDEF)-like protein
LLDSTISDCKASLELGTHDGIPVVFGEDTIATITIQLSGRNLANDEARLVNMVAQKISGALNKAIVLKTAQQEATMDKLTGLANRRAFEKMSEGLGTGGFSIVLVDVNAFKAVNDTFGHQAGDAALTRIAAHIQAAFAGSDLMCRLGGDEFLIVSSDDRRTIRRQIRNFRKLVVSDPEHEPYRKMRFGVSCGLSCVPGEAATIEEALKLADERMYAVKVRFKKWMGAPISAAR